MWPSTINHVLPCFKVEPSAGTRQKSLLPIGCVSSTEVQLGSSMDVQYLLRQPSSDYFLQQQLLSQEQQQQWAQLIQLQQQQKKTMSSLPQMSPLTPAPQPVEQLEQPQQQILPLQVRLQAQSQEQYRSMLLSCQNNQLEQGQLLKRQRMQFGHLLARHKLERTQQYQQCPKLMPVQRQQSLQMEQCFNLQLVHLVERHRLEWYLLSELGSEQPCHLYLLLLAQQRDQIIKLDKEYFLKHQELYSTHVKQRGAVSEMSAIYLSDYYNESAIQ